MKILSILLIVFFLYVVLGFAGEGSLCGKPVPFPRYTEEMGYGYFPVPMPDASNPNCIIKEWRVGSTREIFVDEGQNGVCDVVYIFTLTGEVNEDGQEMVRLTGIHECAFIEEQIKNYLKIKGRI